MVTDIPAPQDFTDFGLDFINLAWRSAMDLLLLPKEWNVGDVFDDEEEWQERYWAAAQRPLAAAASLVHQGAELLIKARIAGVSPFLLITHNPSEWPSGCGRADTPFIDFRTVDARDLVRLHDAACADPLSDRLKGKLEQLRRRRNAIMHGVPRTMRLAAKDVIVDVLEVTRELLGPNAWLPIRRRYMRSDPEGVLATYAEHHVAWLAPAEFEKAVDLLTPKQARDLLGFNKRQRCYVCPVCARLWMSADLDDYPPPTFAQLVPNKPSSTNVHCILCDHDVEVERRDCTDPECPGNVIATEANRCLTCYEPQ